MVSEGEEGARTESNSAGAPIIHYSMECTDKTSNNTSIQSRCKKWALKETTTSQRSAQNPTIKYTVMNTALGGM